jgi:hypothetical protein
MALKNIKSVEILGGYRLKLVFSDGKKKTVDLESRLGGGVFKPLRDPTFFRTVYVEDGTIRWPNGADFDAEVLYYDGPPPWARPGKAVG